MRPNESAVAWVPQSPKRAAVAAARAVFCQRCVLTINLWTPEFGQLVIIFILRTLTQNSKLEKDNNINVLALQAEKSFNFESKASNVKIIRFYVVKQQGSDRSELQSMAACCN
jgi:hypothetical protein